MATKNPRITITLNPNVYRVLQSISETSGQPMSSFVVEMIEGALPTIERMAATFQKVKRAQEGERKRFLEALDDAQSAIEPVVMETIGQFDLFLGKIGTAADALADGGAAAAAGASASPPTNRGDTPQREKRLKASTGKASKPVVGSKVLKKKGA